MKEKNIKTKLFAYVLIFCLIFANTPVNTFANTSVSYNIQLSDKNETSYEAIEDTDIKNISWTNGPSLPVEHCYVVDVPDNSDFIVNSNIETTWKNLSTLSELTDNKITNAAIQSLSLSFDVGKDLQTNSDGQNIKLFVITDGGLSNPENLKIEYAVILRVGAVKSAPHIALNGENETSYEAIEDTDIKNISWTNGPSLPVEHCYVVDVPDNSDFIVNSNIETTWKNLSTLSELTDNKITNAAIQSLSLSFDVGKDLQTNSDGQNIKLFVITDGGLSNPENLKIEYAVILRVGAVKSVTIDKTTLTARITEAQAKNENSYHTSDDRYNGKATSVNGFWADFQTALTRAQTAAEKATTQTEIDAAAGNLEAAMANLISIDNVNPTKLHKAIQSVKYEQKVAEDYTETSWKGFEEAYQAATGEMSKLYQDGVPTEYNKFDLQTSVNEKAEQLLKAEKALETQAAKKNSQWWFELYRKYLPPLVEVAKSAKETDYTTDSWQAFQTALNAADTLCRENTQLPENKDEKNRINIAYSNAFKNLFDAYYCTLTPMGDITVKLTASDSEAARARKTEGVSGYIGDITLSEDYSLDAALEKAGIKPKKSDYPKVYINGIYVSENYVREESGVTAKPNLKLHPNDKVTVAWNYNPSSAQSPTIGEIQASVFQYAESLKTAAFTEGDSITVEAGKAFSLHVQTKPAYLGSNTAAASPAAGMHLYLSEAGSETGNLKNLNALTEGSAAVTTDENGIAKLSLYEPGWYVLSAYDLTKDVWGDRPQWPPDALPTNGNYASVNSGAVIRVHVTESTDLQRVKSSLKKELKAVYEAYPQEYFSTENWDIIVKAYGDAEQGIDSANGTALAREAQQAGITQIQTIQNRTTADNEAKLKSLRFYLEQLPDDVSLLDKAAETTVQEFVSVYEALTTYQREKLLTEAEREKCEAVYAKKDNLAEAKAYALQVNITADNDADKAALEAMIAYLREHNPVKYPQASGTDIDAAEYKNSKDKHKLYQFENNGKLDTTSLYASKFVTLPVDPGYFAYPLIRSTGKIEAADKSWCITDENFSLQEMDYLNNNVTRNFTVTINGNEYEIKNISYDGIDSSKVKRNNGSFIDKTTYKGKKADVVNVHFKEALVYFQMPYQDVTVNVRWGKIDLEGQKTAAVEAVEEAFGKYKLTDYDDAGQTALQKAKTDGITNIKNALTEDGIAEARKAAIAAMAAVAKKTTGSGTEESGKPVGKVYVSVENTTFSGAPAALSGRFVNTEITLYEEDTMMTCVLRALKDKGFGWTGTGGKTSVGKNDMSITYISSITKGNDSLGEFDGGSQSGWMGTLNDFFVNAGFQSFTVKSSGMYKLENGDVISIMYTSKGLGADIGGSWGNSDTSLKALQISGGKLSPAFNGSTLEYTLIISGDTSSITVTPTAANKNYMVRTYLNSYKKESAFYKRTESIPVKAGDVIYVGVGESEWLSMNNQGAEARPYTATKYTIKVVKANTDSVKNAIKALPTEDKITYGNYKSYASAVLSANEMYNALGSEKGQIDTADTAKLNAAVERIQFYTQIDDAKAKLAALPKLNNPTQAQASAYRSQINEATAAYKKLSKEQQKYITKADVENYNALATALGVSTISGSDQAPESPVETTGKSGSATTTAPTEVKVSGTAAEATVKAENQSEILKQAAENKSAEIVLEVAASDTKGAENVQMQLETSFVKSISDKTNASLTLDTANGRVSFDQEALKAIISEAKGSTILIEIAKVTKPTEAQKKAAGTNGDIFRLLVKSGDKIISEFNKGKATVRVEIPAKLTDKKVAAIYIADDAKIEQLAGKVLTIGGKKFYEFTTPHFSTFALVDAEELGLEVEEPQVDAKALTAKLTPVARSTKTAKKNVKVTVSLDKQDKAIIKELKEAGYTVKYRFYRSTKKAAGYKAAVTKKTASYTNTSGKKGTKYFYKVQVRVYDENGKLTAKTALKQCKYASRTWTKK